MDITSVYNNQDSIDYLVEQYLAIESRPKNLLVYKREDLSEKKDVLSNLDSKLSSLKSAVDKLTDPIVDYFATKSATSSDPEKFTVSAGATSELGNHSISAERLAISDTRVSKQYTNTESSFTTFTTDKTFQIVVAHPTDSDPSNRVTIGVTITSDVFTQTDDKVLLDIADAINTAMSNAVADEIIDNNEVVHASVVNEETGKSRLVLRSEQSGYTYRMDFNDEDSLLEAMEVNSANQSSGTSGGYITYVGTSATDSELNAKFVLDGLTIYRDSNNITDALTGITIKLLDTFSTTETITVTPDIDAVKAEVQGFIDSYNGVIKFLRENAQINPDTYERGVLADDITYATIINDLRSIAVSNVTGVTNSDYSKLFNIGIEADEKGNLSIADVDKFTEVLETNSNYVAEIFNSSNGIAVRIKDYIDSYVKTGGTIDSSKKNIDSQISSLNDRIASWDELLSQREAQLRNEFARIQQMMAQLSTQQSFFTSLFNTLYGR